MKKLAFLTFSLTVFLSACDNECQQTCYKYYDSALDECEAFARTRCGPNGICTSTNPLTYGVRYSKEEFMRTCRMQHGPALRSCLGYCSY